MSNPFSSWLQSRKFTAALKQNNIQLAQELLEKKQRLGVKLSLIEKVFRDKLQLEQNSKEYEREVLVLRKRTSQNPQNIQELTNKSQQLEKSVKVKDFIEELGLKLEWYKYMTSTGKRIPLRGEFARFASNNLPAQIHMSPLLRKYLEQKYDSNYVLDDYAILAKKE